MGEPLLDCVYHLALNVCDWLRDNGLVQLDLFPADDGGVMITAYKGDDALNIIITQDERYEIEIERGKGVDYELILDQYDLTLYQVKKMVQDEFILKEGLSYPMGHL